MKKVFVKDIKEKDRIEELFLVTKKEAGVSRSGKSYLNVRLMDKTGELEGRVWEEAEAISGRFERGDVTLVKGYAIAYQGGIQINISEVEKVDATSVSIGDLLPSSARDPEEMMKELEGIIDGITNPHLKGLLKSFTEDEEIIRLLNLAPAAKSIHHSYLGGLLEHTLQLCRVILDVVKHYPGVDRDLLLSGAILHDIGKIYELSYERAFDYTDEGRLLGHITIGVEMVDKKLARMPSFPENLAMLLKHMILSHHGYLEFGSPKRPKTLEAMMFYYLDDMDAKLHSFQTLIEKERDTESRWTSYQKLYDRYIYKGGQGKSVKEEYQWKEMELFEGPNVDR
ncbi:MAG: HD domain-containing protein [Deltaproteobacteria bacterium]|nr:HD domain-containing protein [Deltaproteobacteria bacterium]